MAEWGRGLVLCVGILAGGMHPSIEVGLGEEYHYKKCSVYGSKLSYSYCLMSKKKEKGMPIKFLKYQCTNYIL